MHGIIMGNETILLLTRVKLVIHQTQTWLNRKIYVTANVIPPQTKRAKKVNENLGSLKLYWHING